MSVAVTLAEGDGVGVLAIELARTRFYGFLQAGNWLISLTGGELPDCPPNVFKTRRMALGEAWVGVDSNH
jgi:hypothetical protein